VSTFPSGRRNPFWSAIITQQYASISVAAASWGVVDIQPPVGETWLLYLTTGGNADWLRFIQYRDFDGVTEREHYVTAIDDAYERVKGTSIIKILTNSLYGRLRYYNAYGTAAVTATYGYSGFKLSQPLWSPVRMHNSEPKKWKRGLTTPLPDEISVLTPYAVELWDHETQSYIPSIILEEDTVLAKDPATDFPIERLTSYTTIENLLNILRQRDDPTLRPDVVLEAPPKYRGRRFREITTSEFEETTGYKKYFQRWRKKGIEV